MIAAAEGKGTRTIRDQRIQMKYEGRMGLDPEMFGCNSLRAGFLTESSRTGATIAKMQEVPRHKKVEVLLRYVRTVDLFEYYASEKFVQYTSAFDAFLH